MSLEDPNKKLNKESLVTELKLRDKPSWGEKLLKMKSELMQDSHNQRAPTTTPHQDKPSFRKESPTDLLKNLLWLDLHPQELQEPEPLTLQADNNTVDTVCQEAPSKTRFLTKENTHH